MTETVRMTSSRPRCHPPRRTSAWRERNATTGRRRGNEREPIHRHVDLSQPAQRSRRYHRLRQAGVRARHAGDHRGLVRHARRNDRRPRLVALAARLVRLRLADAGAVPGARAGRGEEWIYDYIGWLVPVWPNSNAQLQRAAMVGSVVRTVPHSSNGGTAPAGVVASFYAVRVGDGV